MFSFHGTGYPSGIWAMPNSAVGIPHMDKILDRASQMWAELRKGEDAAKFFGFVVLILALSGPLTVDKLIHPDLALYEVALRTLPLTLAVCAVVTAVSKNWFDHPYSYVVFTAFALIASALIASFVDCGECGGMDQLQLASKDAQKWTPKWMLDSGLGGIPFIIAALYEYLVLYSMRYSPGTFIASLICGWFLAATLIRVANSAKAKSNDVA
jgi:hypothetical protein